MRRLQSYKGYNVKSAQPSFLFLTNVTFLTFVTLAKP